MRDYHHPAGPIIDPRARVAAEETADNDPFGMPSDPKNMATPQHVLVSAVHGGEPADTTARAPGDTRDLPPDVGRCAYMDQATGEVHGGGAGDGGGNASEDYDPDSSGGGLYPRDGVEARPPAAERDPGPRGSD